MKVHSAKLSEKTQQVLVPLTWHMGTICLSADSPVCLNARKPECAFQNVFGYIANKYVRAGIIPPLMYICRSRG